MADKTFTTKGFSSAALHAHNNLHPNSAHTTPIYASSTFVFDTAQQGMERFSGQQEGYVYSRWGNPTFADAERVIEALETYEVKDDNGQPLQVKAILHASGQAAMTTLFMSNLSAGDKMLSHYSLYGGTHELVTKVLKECGIEAIISDMRNADEVEALLKQDPAIKLVHIETPANPTIQCIDIAAISAIAKKYNCIVSVDNTFATPYLQRPFALGADFVFHSTTKFLNGHGTAIGGVLLGKDLDFMKTKATKWHRLIGGSSNPFDAFLLLQGLKTLEIRMDRHCANAKQVAQYLQQHPSVAHVNYNGLPTHPGFAITQKQMSQPGAMVSFELEGGLDAGIKFINKLQMCIRAVSLGSVDTLISHPASMTHYGVGAQERLQYGITDGLIRMSVGIESVEDIIADLEQALEG
ncbi:trans-sulfuration enzyme family protein [Aridibaculum aurantiacum]|uniref:trans-sulfuration enzyme family protein n=1 Tax=Aridibaculum aurantiacum TaxID=2810307 RepID=UPI001A96DC3F|nr:aminotransferase class I/II-fold pyridoxal phosphate-dependent enzyme [Aridibaculum aurantiacum]